MAIDPADSKRLEKPKYVGTKKDIPNTTLKQKNSQMKNNVHTILLLIPQVGIKVVTLCRHVSLEFRVDLDFRLDSCSRRRAWKRGRRR